MVVDREIPADSERFGFGRNWQSFLAILNDQRIAGAEESLRVMLGMKDLHGKTFLDIGSGSGLFSLAARRLGARVRSFDYDPDSVTCTAELKRRYYPDDTGWVVEGGSVLDAEYLKSLGQFDIVYSWGVLHHTGAMWQALGNAVTLVGPGGQLFIAIYNDQGKTSYRWNSVKQLYNRLPNALRFTVLWPAFIRLWGPSVIRDILRGAPLRSWRASRVRGMSPWHDTVDWVGGYPFEVAKPEEIFDFCLARGFVLKKLVSCGGGIGCNEFVFEKQ